jgi:hypothetical protein
MALQKSARLLVGQRGQQGGRRPIQLGNRRRERESTGYYVVKSI